MRGIWKAIVSTRLASYLGIENVFFFLLALIGAAVGLFALYMVGSFIVMGIREAGNNDSRGAAKGDNDEEE